jgi:hypothetical protein
LPARIDPQVPVEEVCVLSRNMSRRARLVDMDSVS